MEVDSGSTRLIDVTIQDLEKSIEKMVTRVLDARIPREIKYYTVAELAKILDCSKLTIYKLKDEQRISYRRMNGRKSIRFTQADIDEFMKKNPGFREEHGQQ